MKTPTLSPSDTCKTLISDMSAEEIEDVIRYGKFRIHQLRQKARVVLAVERKKAAKNGIPQK